MFRALRQNISPATLAQLVVELVWLFVAGVAVLHLASTLREPARAVVVPALMFALLILSLNGAFGIYRRGEKVTTAGYVLRLLLAPLIGVPLAYMVAHVVPGGREFQENWDLVALFGIGGLLLVRHALVLPLVTTLLPHRVLVLGTGPEARLVEASLASAQPPGMRLVGFFALEKVTESVVSPGQVIAANASLADVIRDLSVNEIIVAVRQQRGGVLPLRALLDCRLAGVEITDLARFFERVHGKVPIELLTRTGRIEPASSPAATIGVWGTTSYFDGVAWRLLERVLCLV